VCAGVFANGAVTIVMKAVILIYILEWCPRQASQQCFKILILKAVFLSEPHRYPHKYPQLGRAAN
jgi:hypothetical protein